MREFHKETLDNGLTILFEKRNLPLVTVAAAARQGFGYESLNKKGISHLLEHMIHKGTENRSHKEITEEIEKKGGVMNAFTDEEVTAFWNKLPSKYFSSGADIVSDLVLNPKLPEEEFDKEKKVVMEEIKMHRDNPKHYVLDKIKELLYKKPFGASGIGKLDSVSKLSRKDLINCHKNNYKTNKMILSVVGNTSMDKIKEFGERFPKSKSKQKELKPAKINDHRVETREGIKQANLAVGFHTASMNNDKRYAWEILDAILAKGMSSRLFEEIREKRGLAYTVNSFMERGKNYGYNIVYVGTTKDKVDKCKEIVLKEIKELQNLEKSDFEEAKEQLIGLREVGSEESVNTMHELIEEEIGNDARAYYDYKENIKKVKLKQVQELANLKNYSSLSLLPESK